MIGMRGPVGLVTGAIGLVVAFLIGISLILLTPVRDTLAARSQPSPSAIPGSSTATVTATATATATATVTSGPASAPSPTGSPSSSDALAMDEATAAAWLARIRSEDAAAVANLSGVWVVQLSSKCAALNQADLGDPVGAPDGRAETYPSGLGSARILAYHLAMRERYGSGVVLAKPTDLGSTNNTSSACDGTPLWVTIDTSSVYSNSDGALAWCDAAGLPQYECGARPVGIPGETKVVGR